MNVGAASVFVGQLRAWSSKSSNLTKIRVPRLTYRVDFDDLRNCQIRKSLFNSYCKSHSFPMRISRNGRFGGPPRWRLRGAKTVNLRNHDRKSTTDQLELKSNSPIWRFRKSPKSTRYVRSSTEVLLKIIKSDKNPCAKTHVSSRFRRPAKLPDPRIFFQFLYKSLSFLTKISRNGRFGVHVTTRGYARGYAHRSNLKVEP